MTQLQQAMSSIIPGLALSSIGFSEDILPVQDMYENEEVKGHLHKAWFLHQEIFGWWLMPLVMAMRNSEPWSTVNTQTAIGVVYLRRHISWLSVTSAVMTSSWLIANQGHPFPIFHSLLNSYFSAREVEFALTKHPRRQNDLTLVLERVCAAKSSAPLVLERVHATESPWLQHTNIFVFC